MNLSDALSLIRKIPDYPKPGILFQDITPILSHSAAFESVISALCKDLSDTDTVVGIEARGFIFASAMANRMKCGFVPLRKAGKLPFDVFSQTYELEYGTASLEIHRDAIAPGSKVVLVDDVLATGGTIEAGLHLIQKTGGVIQSVAVLMEISALAGRNKIAETFPSIQIDSLLSV